MSSNLPVTSVISWRATSRAQAQNSVAPARLETSSAMAPSSSVSRACMERVRPAGAGSGPGSDSEDDAPVAADAHSGRDSST